MTPRVQRISARGFMRAAELAWKGFNPFTARYPRIDSWLIASSIETGLKR
jgi:hypothetical protein